MTKLDDAIQESGGFGIFQVLFVTTTALFSCIVGANMAAAIFEAFVPTTYCKSPFEMAAIQICPEAYQQLLTPEEDGEVDFCYRYNFTEITNELESVDSNDTSCNFQVNSSATKIVKCDSWTYDQSVMRNSIVTDFNLVCGSQWGGYLSQSSLMMGVAIGSVLTGYISDRFGRRHALLIVCIGMTISGSLLSITKSYVAYSLTRAILGIFAYSPFLVLFVHALEFTIPKYRPIVAQALELSFPVGFGFLVLISYILREWRKIQLALSLPCAAGIIIWWLSPESPRWLMTRNRPNDSSDVIARIARINRSKAPSTEEKKELSIEPVPKTESRSFFKVIFKTPSLRSASLRMFYNWFAVSCVYYGLTMNAAELSGGPFINLLAGAAAEVVAVILTIPLIHICGRRITGSLSEIMAGILCIFIQLVSNKTATAVLAVLGKFAISISFSTMFITASEIYPTEIRNFATGLCNAMARLGGVVSPLIALTTVINKVLPYVIFGALSLVAGLVILTLPETKGVPLPQTIADGVEFLERNSGVCSSKRKGKNLKHGDGEKV